MRVDPTRFDGIGAEFDFESDLGLGDSPGIGFAELGYRFAPHWTVNVQYQRLSCDQSVSLTRDITAGDTIFPVDTRVDVSFASNLYKAHVNWSPLRTERAEVGLSFGAHVTDFSFAIEAEGNVGGIAGATREERREITAPLPNMGASVSYEVAPRLRVAAKVNYLQLRIDEPKVGLTDIEASLAYDFARRITAGAGYRSFKYRLDVESERFKGQVRNNFGGLFASMMARFWTAAPAARPGCSIIRNQTCRPRAGRLSGSREHSPPIRTPGRGRLLGNRADRPAARRRYTRRHTRRRRAR